MSLQNESRTQNVYPTKKLNMKDFFLPQISKKRVIHTKNPFKIRPIFYPDESKRAKISLNGILLLQITHAELPHEVIKADLSNKNINTINGDDLKYFVNLENLDLSENNVDISQLSYLPNLISLKLQTSLLTSLPFNENLNFPKLQELNLSFNKLDNNEIKKLCFCKNLKILSLSGNELKEIPEELNEFKMLENLDLSINSFNSEFNAARFWYSLANIKNLKELNISRNFLRGIHTERLVAGNFSNLEKLDFSYNIVENQHNLICSRNFRKMKILIVTGNPFALKKEHKGLEMEIYARTGAELINNEISKHYLKKINERKLRKPVFYDNIIRLQDQILKKDNKTYFFGVELPGYSLENELAKKGLDKENKKIDIFNYENNEDEGDQAKFFLTEDPNPIKPILNSIENVDQFPKEKHNDSLNEKLNSNYEEFRTIAQNLIGEEKEYENPINITSAYKILKDLVKKPNQIDFNDFVEPHFMKNTAVIQKFKFNEEIKELEKLSEGYIKTNEKKFKPGQIKNVEKILDELEKKLKKI